MDRVLDESEDYLEEQKPKSRVLDDQFLRESIAVLQPANPVCAETGSTVAQVIREMQEHRIGCVLIVDGGKLVGIFTERDVLRSVVGASFDPESTPVDRLMTANPEALHPTDDIVFALNKMSLGGFRHVPLVDEEHRPVGVISVKDIVDYIVECFSHEVLNVPPEPGRDVAKEPDGA